MYIYGGQLVKFPNAFVQTSAIERKIYQYIWQRPFYYVAKTASSIFISQKISNENTCEVGPYTPSTRARGEANDCERRSQSFNKTEKKMLFCSERTMIMARSRCFIIIYCKVTKVKYYDSSTIGPHQSSIT